MAFIKGDDGELHEVRIVAGVAHMTAVGALGEERTAYSVALEEAMVDAVHEAMADGVSLENSEEILRRKMVAKDAVDAMFAGR